MRRATFFTRLIKDLRFFILLKERHPDLSPEVGADLRYQALLYPAVDDGLHNRRLTVSDAGHKGHKGVRGTCVSFFSPFNSALRVSISPPE